MSIRHVRLLTLLGVCLATWCGRSLGSDIVPVVAANKDWDVDAASATYTGGGKGPATVQLVLNKSAVSGRTVTIQSDGDFVSIGDDPVNDVRVTFKVAVANPATDVAAGDGSVSTLALVTGDHPSVSFDGRESVRENGHWRRVAKSPAKTFTLTLTNATFAIVKFAAPSSSANAQAVALLPNSPKAAPGPARATPAVKPNKLQLAANKFADAVARRCPYCSGVGQVSRQEELPAPRNHYGLTVPQYRTVTSKCTACDGTGVVHGRPEAILGQSGEMLRTLIAVDMNNPSTQDVVKATYQIVTANAIGDRRAWDILTRDAHATLAFAHPRAGTPLITEAIVDQAVTDADGRRTFHVHLPRTNNTFIVENPPSADNVTAGPVLIGGLIDRTLPADGKQPAQPVLCGAFLIAPTVNPAWTWWVTQ